MNSHRVVCGLAELRKCVFLFVWLVVVYSAISSLHIVPVICTRGASVVIEMMTASSPSTYRLYVYRCDFIRLGLSAN